jgi:sulfoxide reductase catalytic subunit YedY
MTRRPFGSSRDLVPTPPEVFFDRRQFVSALGIGLFAAASANCQSTEKTEGTAERSPLDLPFERPGVFPAKRNETIALPGGLPTQLTDRLVAATHNNFYEFLPGRGGPAWEHTEAFEVVPWQVEVVGECAKPRTFDLDALFAFPHEERVYHFRCVERWAMNVPWSGFPLSRLLDAVEPTANARYVRFVTANRPEQMPGIREAHWYPWPYFEGLRMDEARNDLAFVATGVYGAPLPKQHGAPVRIAVPWKYGYKNPKSIVRIELVREEPKTFWQIQPHEYGFLSNVNPYLPHPRWGQDVSYWLGSNEGFPTQIFNGYAEQVAHLYPDEPRTLQRPLQAGQVAR